MADVTIRDLRNNGGRVLERVARGESLTVTMDGRAVAELRPLPGKAVDATVLIRRWQRLPAINAKALRNDIRKTLNDSL